ncbi:hypothetical protein RB195_015473 [Necator americanus]|uniref:7TM GPCR serpentine receptor class x (Srx) domain-containing protein n=1 Tax=Necator americanus TaxID=51031 RepID=A0ABR1E6L8_NECAM
MVYIYLDPLVNLTSVASVLWVLGRAYGVINLVSNEEEEVAIGKAASSLTIVTIILNMSSNIMKFFDSRYMWSFTLPSYIFLQLLLVVCEMIILVIFASSTTISPALSFLVDVGYIALMIVFMETTSYVLHRVIRTKEYDAMKKRF